MTCKTIPPELLTLDTLTNLCQYRLTHRLLNRISGTSEMTEPASVLYDFILEHNIPFLDAPDPNMPLWDTLPRRWELYLADQSSKGSTMISYGSARVLYLLADWLPDSPPVPSLTQILHS